MSISSSYRKAGPYIGNGVTTVLPFSFKVFSGGDVMVVRTNLSGAESELLLTTHYTVSLNADQDTNPGGSVTLVSAASDGYLTTITSKLAELQPVVLTNAGGFYPRVINDALDRLTILIQQLSEKVSRTLQYSISSPLGNAALPAPTANYVIGWNSEANGFQNYAPSDNTFLSVALAQNGGAGMIGFLAPDGSPKTLDDLASSAGADMIGFLAPDGSTKTLADLELDSGAALIGFKQAGIGTVSRNLLEKVSDSFCHKDFGVVADGIADDTVNFQAMLNAASGRTINLQGKTIKVTASLSIPFGTTIENGTIDGSGMANNDTLLEAYGALGAAAGMDVIARGATTFVVSSADGLSNNDYLYVESGTIFGMGATKNGEFAKIRSLAGTTITPYRRIYDNYQSAQQFYKPTLVRNITLRNLKLIGGGNGKGHTAFHAYLAENIVIEGCRSSFFGNRHFQVQRCLNARFSANHVEHSDTATGLAYGFVVANGCDNITIIGNTGNDIRHGVAVGAENGVDRNVSIIGNTFNDCTDAGIDTHPQAQFITISGNTSGNGSTGSSVDGIVCQGTDCVISDNVVHGFSRVGILIQPMCVSASIGDSTVCTGNSVSKCVAGATDAYGISYDNQRTGVNARVNICGNTVAVDSPQGYGISIELNAAGSDVNGVVIDGNNVFSRRSALRVFTAATKLARCFAVSGNAFETIDLATYDVISLVASTVNYIERAIITGNSIFGGRYGINATSCSRIVANSNMIQSFATGATNGLAAGVDNYTS